MENLDIGNFSSFFELLTGFYIYLGISETLPEGFNINYWIKSFVTSTQKNNINLKIESDIHEIAQQESINKEELKKNIDEGSLTFKNLVKLIRKYFKNILKRKKRLNKTCKYYLKYEFLEVVLFMYDKDNNYLITHNSKLKSLDKAFLKIITPTYLYFGILNFSILILTEFVSKSNKLISLQVINTFSFIIVLQFFIRVFFLYYFKRLDQNFSKRKIIVFNIFLFLFLLAYIAFCPTNKGFILINQYDYIENINVTLCVLFPILPLVTHILLIHKMVRYQIKSKKMYLKEFRQNETDMNDIIRY